jgi:hypothetical protein
MVTISGITRSRAEWARIGWEKQAQECRARGDAKGAETAEWFANAGWMRTEANRG